MESFFARKNLRPPPPVDLARRPYELRVYVLCRVVASWDKGGGARLVSGDVDHARSGLGGARCVKDDHKENPAREHVVRRAPTGKTDAPVARLIVHPVGGGT